MPHEGSNQNRLVLTPKKLPYYSRNSCESQPCMNHPHRMNTIEGRELLYSVTLRLFQRL
jgi:hypothetical protein